VLGFGARAMGEDQKPKYLNSSDNAVYHKGRHLFGADIARAPAAKAGAVIVAEGYTDVIAMHQAGLRHTVGLMGTALTDEQVGELARLAPTVLLALDADAAGQEAMLRGARVAARRNLALRVVPLPAGSDPADLVAAEGPRALSERVDASVPFVRFRVERALDAGDLTRAEGKDAVMEALRPVFAQIPPSAMRDELVGVIADRMNLAPSVIAERLSAGSAPAPAGNGAGAPRGAPTASLDPTGRAEHSFLAQCLAAPAAGRDALAALDLDAMFTTDLTRRAAAHVRDRLASGADVPAGDEELVTLMAELVVRAGEMRSSEAAVAAERLRLKLLALDRRIAASKAAGEPTSALSAERQELRRELGEAEARSLEETLVRE
jgi:DNA primase